MPDFLREALTSKKFWVAVLGSLVAAVGGHLGIDPEAQKQIVTLATGYVVGQGIADLGLNKAAAPPA